MYDRINPILFPKIEKALNITLWDSVKRSLENGDAQLLCGGRRCGQTLTHVLLLCFTSKELCYQSKRIENSISRHANEELYRVWNLLNEENLPIGNLIIVSGNKEVKELISNYNEISK